MNKYITKYCKYLTLNDKETPELRPFVEQNNKQICQLVSLIRDRRQEIVTKLYQKQNLTDIHAHEPLIRWFVHDVSQFSFKLHDGVFKNKRTAKQKMVEHWIERLPTLVFVSFISLVLKTIQTVYVFPKEIVWSLIDLITHCYLFFVVIYMVYLRVPQCIFADAKQNASNKYFEFKTNLHRDLLNGVV